MFVVGEILGWENKFPIMVVDWAISNNQEEVAQIQSIKNNQKFIEYITKIENNIHSLHLNFNTIEDVINEFKYNIKINNNIFNNIDVKYDGLNSIIFNTCGNVFNYKIPIWNFNVKETLSCEGNILGVEEFDTTYVLNVLENFGLKNCVRM